MWDIASSNGNTLGRTMHIRYGGQIRALAITGALLLASTPSDAARRPASRSSYDGQWSVAIYTQRGDCGAVRAALRIIGGRVYAVDQSYQANGAVGAGGAIRVTVASGGRSASGSGRLSRTTGSGRWRSSGGECLGTWSAERRPDYY
jgi:hypothetical protein